MFSWCWKNSDAWHVESGNYGRRIVLFVILLAFLLANEVGPDPWG